MNITRLSIDLAKDVFQLHGVDGKQKCVLTKRITSRAKLIEFISRLKACEIYMEACGSSNYWARTFQGYGHTVKLISPQYVKPYIQRNKNDYRDAQGIMEASFWAGTPYVTPKTVEQQDIQSLLRIRSNYIEIRTTVSNQLRGLMKEYGVFVAAGYQKLKQALPGIFDRNIENSLTPQMKELIEGQYNMLLIFDEKIDKLDIQIEQISKQHEVCQRLQQIEGIGPITALAIVALVGNGQGFKNGRHFSAYLGLVPRQYSSGQKEKLLGISKRGDVYLRELLIHGGRSVVMHCNQKSDARSIWVNKIKDTGGMNKAAVAVANKNARIVMAMLLSGDNYQKAA